MNKVRIIDIIKRLDHLKSITNRSGGEMAYDMHLRAFWPELRQALIETANLKGLDGPDHQ